MKYMKRLLLFLLPLLAFSGCEEEITYVSPYGSIYGIVTEEGSSQPMEGLAVELYKDEALIRKTVTAADGSYSFDEVAIGKYTLIAKGYTYSDAKFTVEVASGQQARADMQLKKANTYMDITTESAEIIGNRVIFNGSIYSRRGVPVTKWGFVYSTAADLSNATQVTASKDENHDYDFSMTATVTNLPFGTYYVAAFGTNEYGTTYGNTFSFEISGLPVVVALPATNVTTNTAILNGRIDYAGNPAFTEHGFVYSTIFPKPTIDDDPQSTTRRKVSGTEHDFSANISGLDKSKTYYARAYAINERGIAYSEGITFGYPGQVPTVKISEVSDITETSVTFNGTIENEGYPPYTERGFVYSTTSNPTVNSNKVVSYTDKSEAQFSAQVKNLTLEATYYIRAYATNEEGTAYSDETTFTYAGQLAEVKALPVSNITETSATLNASIENAGFPSYTERGFVYSTSHTPTINDNKVISYTEKSATQFSAQMNNLELESTYYIRAYAINEMGVAYSDEITLAHNSKSPIVNASSVSNVSESSVIFNGSITYEGFPSYTERGFVFSTSHKPTIDDNKIISHTTKSSKQFNVQVNDLVVGTTYYIRAYAINKMGMVYSNNELTFTYSGQLPIVKTLSTIDAGATTATLQGNITSVGIPAYTERGFVYSSSFQNPTINDEKRIVSGSGTGNFSFNLSGLTAGTTYYVRAYATNSEGTAYGESVSFTPQHPEYLVFPSVGLMVQRNDISGDVEWGIANTLCQSSQVGGFSDWRLPSLGELYILYNLFLEEKITNITIDSDYWSNEQGPKNEIGSYKHYFFNFMSGGSGWTYSDTSRNRVRAVRTIN